MKKIFYIPANFLFEGFEYKGGKYIFNPKTNNDTINTALGKSGFSPRVTKLTDGVNVFSAYSKGNKNIEEVRNILNALKKRGDELEENSYNQFINRTAIFFYHLLKNHQFDLILTIQSSSGISKDLKQSILSRLPYKPIVFDEAIKKNLNQAEYAVEQEHISEKTLKSIERNIQKQLETTGYFKIQKIPARFRKFVRNWLKIDDKVRSKILGANVLLIDDFLTSGSTLLEASKLLKDLGAKQITLITLIK